MNTFLPGIKMHCNINPRMVKNDLEKARAAVK
jgi:hypothetical protein